MSNSFAPYEIPELCPYCKKRPVYYTGHGIRNGAVYDDCSCVPCYAKRHVLSKEKAERLEAEVVPEVPQKKTRVTRTSREKPAEPVVARAEAAVEPPPPDPKSFSSGVQRALAGG